MVYKHAISTIVPARNIQIEDSLADKKEPLADEEDSLADEDDGNR